MLISTIQQKFLLVLSNIFFWCSRWLFSTNHKDIGTAYIVFGGVSGIVGTGMSMLIRIQLMSPGNVFLGNNQLYNGAPSHAIYARNLNVVNIVASIMIFFIYVVNHYTYSIGIQTEYVLNILRTIACVKRLTERMFAKILFIMDRLTNPIFVPGFKFPRIVLGVSNYVILDSQKRPKQAPTGCGLAKGSPKINVRRRLMEFGISQYVIKSYGKRRTRSTVIFNRKGSSLTCSTNYELSGSSVNEQLFKLNSNLAKGLKADNFSEIMSDSDFLISCWKRLVSNKNSNMLFFYSPVIRHVEEEWFVDVAYKIKNGRFNFQPIRQKSKLNGRFEIKPSIEDAIVHEGMRFLLELLFRKNFYNYEANKNYLFVLNDIQTKCKDCSWFIEGKFIEQSSDLNYTLLVSTIKKKVNDQAFVDLLYKYINVNYDEVHFNSTTRMRKSVVLYDDLFSILVNIYMHSLDEWAEKKLVYYLINKNPFPSNRIKDKIFFFNPENLSKHASFSKKQVFYFRYADDFIFGVQGSLDDCVYLQNHISIFLQKKFSLILDADKIKIKHINKDFVMFLGYSICKKNCNVTAKPQVNSRKYLQQRAFRFVLEAPIKDVVKELIGYKYATKKGEPTRNVKIVNYSLYYIIEHYKKLEKSILNYYSFANNYNNLAVKVHYILKYSCVLTIASKMKLKTKKKVFRKFGKELSITDENGKILTMYPSINRRI